MNACCTAKFMHWHCSGHLERCKWLELVPVDHNAGVLKIQEYYISNHSKFIIFFSFFSIAVYRYIAGLWKYTQCMFEQGHLLVGLDDCAFYANKHAVRYFLVHYNMKHQPQLTRLFHLHEWSPSSIYARPEFSITHQAFTRNQTFSCQQLHHS